MRQPYAHVANEFNQRISFVVVFFSLSLKARVAMRFTAEKRRVIKMQNVTLWIDL